MWSDKGDDTAGGGYFGNDFQSSPSVESGEKKVPKAHNCVPLTISHILNSTEEILKVGKNGGAHVITIVGRLIQKNADSTKLSYEIDDGTGKINCFDFKANDDDVSAVSTEVELNQYYRVYGSLRLTEGKHHILVFRIQPVENVNEITTHILEVMYAPAHLDELERGGHTKGAGMAGSHDNSMRNSMADVHMGGDGGGGMTNVSGFTRKQQAVYEAVKNFNKHSTGIHKSEVANSIQMKIDKNEIDEILEFLTSEGHIYTTTDSSHFRTTDG